MIDEARTKQMAAPGLQEPRRRRSPPWTANGTASSRTADYPMIGLDNNAAERMIRGPVVTRKNAGGSRNGDSARLAAVIWTVTATAQMAGLNLLTWLTAYLDECGRNGGKPPPARTWNGSCPGTPAPTTSTPGHSRRQRPDKPAREHAITGVAAETATPAISMPAHRTSEYLRPGSLHPPRDLRDLRRPDQQGKCPHPHQRESGRNDSYRSEPGCPPPLGNRE